ncbi:MAG: 50S ribosomal protein L24 [Alphaproteobacteria bacterium]|nr:MAG: 50S ribosomal protein L24 [Alphaproteobacteria bacterium]
MPKYKFKSGDKVIVITGSDRGKVSSILAVDRKNHKVLVKGVNEKKLHKKSDGQNQGGIISVERPIDISNVAHVLDGKAAKVKYDITGEKKKLVFKKNGAEVRK